MILTTPSRPLWLPSYQPTWAAMPQQQQRSLHRGCCCICSPNSAVEATFTSVALCSCINDMYKPIAHSTNSTHVCTYNSGSSSPTIAVYEKTVTDGFTYEQYDGTDVCISGYSGTFDLDLYIRVRINCTCPYVADVLVQIVSAPFGVGTIFSAFPPAPKGGGCTPATEFGESLANDRTSCATEWGKDGSVVVTR